MPNSRLLPTLLALLALLALLGACGSNEETAEGAKSAKLSLIAYSTPKEAYEAVIPAFQKTAAGKGVTFDQSYGASGDQTRAVLAGLPADVITLSLAPDMDKLVEGGIADAGWSKDEFGGNVTDSVVVLAVRKGNPKGIRSWDDLVKPGVEVLTPNPFTSGGARWNLMAAYGAKRKEGASEAQSLDFLKQVLKHTPVQDKSAREALQTFAGGKGDVLLAYENEAITAQAKGVELDYVIPDATILIENPIAVSKKSKSPEQAKAFVDFARSPEGQKLFASKGYRPVRPDLVDAKRFPTPSKLFKIGEVGGWNSVMKKYFDPEGGAVAEIEKDLGVSTAK
jgi:sulfate/thiosulfate transport system substrate-binding protein